MSCCSTFAVCTQELEFIIHADGRVEERVRGIKGSDCTAVTEDINKALGEVFETKPTAEMFEEKVELFSSEEASVSETWGEGTTGGGSGTNEW